MRSVTTQRFIAGMAVSILLVTAIIPDVGAAQDGPVRLGAGVSYELIDRWDAERLNRILKQDIPAFAGVTADYSPASAAVNLYRVTYASVVPERGNKPITATGLVAVPENPGARLPLVSYQHGTVFGKQEVPSFPEQSSETQLMIAQFAGQGYALIGADYFGLGTSDEPDGYAVKASHQQATYDMLIAGREVLTHLGLETPDLFLAGWSQGGFVTMAMTEKLENTDVEIKAAATASAPTDFFVLLNSFLDFPRPIDADWVGVLFILSPFSFENYYGVPGLARSVLRDDAYEVAQKAYARQPFDVAEIPTDLRKLVRSDYFDPQYFAASAYGRLVAATQAYRWVVRTPVRNYYGKTDEVVSANHARLAATYQQAIGNNRVEAISTGDTNHRATFALAVPQWKKWFDSLTTGR